MDLVAERQRESLKLLADLRDGESPVARLAVGDVPGAQRIIDGLIQDNARWRDCADFRLSRLIRTKLLFGQLLPQSTHDAIARSLLAARHYGGWREDYPMFYSSENHHFCWAVAEYLTAQLYPQATFEFDSRPASAHRDRARFLIASWINRRARWGFCEWNSSPYMNVNVNSLLNLVDFADEPAIRQLAADMMTKLLADLLADSAQGGLWAAQARVYHNDLFRRHDQSIGLPLWIYGGQGDMPKGHAFQSLSAAAVATSTYRPPGWIETLAALPQLTNRECHRLEVGVFYHNRSLYWRPPFELTNEDARQQLMPTALVPIPVRTERRPGSVVSAAIFTQLPIPHRENLNQCMIWMGCLNGRCPIFTTHPRRPGHGHADREYWAGTATVPRCYLQDGILCAVYHNHSCNPQTQDFTHAYFPTPDFDAWKNDGRWYFARSGEGFAALLAPAGASLTTSGPCSGREIIAPGRRGAWLAVFSSASREGSFENFIDRCRKMDCRYDPSQGVAKVRTDNAQWEVSYSKDIIVDDQPVRFDTWPQMDNELLHADFGSPILRIRTSQGDQSLDFSAAETIKNQWERSD